MIKISINCPSIKTSIFEILIEQAHNNVDTLLSQGIDEQLIDRLRHVSLSDSKRAAQLASASIEVTLNEIHFDEALAQVTSERQIPKLQEYFVRNGATLDMISFMFRISVKEAKAARKHLLPCEKKGRPPMPDQFVRETIHQNWALIVKANPRSPTRDRLHTLHQSFPSHSLATLWAVINEFGPAADSSTKIGDKHCSKHADNDTSWQGGSCIHKLDC